MRSELSDTKKLNEKNILPEHRYKKSSQQNISKSNPPIYENDTLQPSEVYLKKATLIQHLKINQCNSSY